MHGWTLAISVCDIEANACYSESSIMKLMFE